MRYGLVGSEDRSEVRRVEGERIERDKERKPNRL